MITIKQSGSDQAVNVVKAMGSNHLSIGQIPHLAVLGCPRLHENEAHYHFINEVCL